MTITTLAAVGETLDADNLNKLYDALQALIEVVNEDTLVPERYKATAAGNLAEADYDALRRASSVVHRIMIWQRYPSVSPESYITPGLSVDA